MKTFMKFSDYQQRVINEHRELTVKLNNLLGTFSTPMFAGLDIAEQVRMRAQAVFMRGYQDMLEERIEAIMASENRSTANETTA